MPLLTEISNYLDTYFQIHQYPQEQHGIWKMGNGLVRKIGLVLEPWPELYAWILQQNLDAVFIHRPWQLNVAQFPALTGILSYHLPFDEKLTLGYNLLLATQLNITEVEPLGMKEGRPLGMTGNIPPVSIETFTANIESLFGLPEQIHPGKFREISKIAVMGAMTEALVSEAFHKGVQLYLTGQFRKPAAKMVEQTGLHVIATGHRQSERYGLTLLANLLNNQWSDLQVYTPPV